MGRRKQALYLGNPQFESFGVCQTVDAQTRRTSELESRVHVGERFTGSAASAAALTAAKSACAEEFS